MPAPSSELFHGTITSDVGASWLPRTDMPAIAFTPPVPASSSAPGAPSSAACPSAALAASASATPRTILVGIASPLRRDAAAKIRDPDRRVLVIRHERRVRLVVRQRAAEVAEIEIADDREILRREVKIGQDGERPLVARARLRKTALPAPHEPELVERDRMVRVQRERRLEARRRPFEIARAGVGDPEVDMRVHEARRLLRDPREIGRAHVCTSV